MKTTVELPLIGMGFTVITSGKLADVIAHVRERQLSMQQAGLSTEGERAGALWAIDAIEQGLGLKPDPFADDIHELTHGSVRGG